MEKVDSSSNNVGMDDMQIEKIDTMEVATASGRYTLQL